MLTQVLQTGSHPHTPLVIDTVPSGHLLMHLPVLLKYPVAQESHPESPAPKQLTQLASHRLHFPPD